MKILLLLLTLLGHAFFWIGLINRLHAIDIPRRPLKIITYSLFLFVGGVAVLVVRRWVMESGEPAPLFDAYLVLCRFIAPATILRLLYVRFRYRRPALVRRHSVRRANLDLSSAAKNGERARHVLTRLPLNEILRLEVSDWSIDVPRLPPALDRLSIIHLSDLHFTGRVGKAYFREVVRTCNECEPDLTCITGDIIDRACCFDWIADTVGRLSARHGVYFILGNHDREVDTNRLRQTLTQCGLIDLGGRWASVDILETTVLIAGNERPWFPSDTRLPPAENGDLRIALAHSPDQLSWARRWRADLMLAGHTHGGQIRIPPLGAIFSPSIEGVKFLSGVYSVPPTILHVSRGLSGDIPVRWNCPPEISRLRLLASGRASSNDA
jgi:uncharacterized protein